MTGRRPAPEFHVTVARNAILDCLHSSEEPDFIRKICGHGLLGSEARRIVDKLAPHIVALAGRTVQECRA
ncbi:MAG: hypothetical protein ACOH2H_11030 [Cypionkella sp.]